MLMFRTPVVHAGCAIYICGRCTSYRAITAVHRSLLDAARAAAAAADEKVSQ